MKKNCPGCQALREEAAKPHSDIGDLLVHTALHELSPECSDKKPAAKNASHPPRTPQP
ncbi:MULTISPECIES: hypothetical protein [unclassified Streptomyces]|uniref:hypothetical protein n=1 Tax=unclassified Streptomyces TaxID=2593676 RepID=UPI003807FA83